MFFYVFIYFFCSIEDPLKKNATIGFINNFGQIPKQLFKKTHPCKKMGQRISVLDPSSLTGPPLPLAPDRIFYHNLDSLRPSLHPIKGCHFFLIFRKIFLNHSLMFLV